MKKAFPLALLALAFSSSWSFGVDLTPRFFEKQFSNGATLRTSYFADKERKFTVSQTFDTELSGNKEEATFRFQNLEGASLILRNAPEPLSFGEDEREAFRPIAESFAPNGALPEGDWEERTEPINYPGFKSFGLIRVYKLPGSTIRQSVIFVKTGKQQDFIMVTTAFSPQFKAALERSQELIGSWRELSDDDFAGPALN